MKNIWKCIKEFIKQQIFPGLYAYYANKIISEEYETQKEYIVDVTGIQGKEDEFIEQVKADLEKQLDRKKIIEDKAKSLLFIITVAITTVAFSLNYLSSLINNTFQIISIALVILSIIYFVFGAIRVLQTLNLRPFHITQADIKTVKEDQKIILYDKAINVEILKEIIRNKVLNDHIVLRLSNYTYASFNLIRNGTIIFVLFFITTIVISILNREKDTTTTYIVHKKNLVQLNDSISVEIPYTLDIKYSVKNLKLEKKEK